MVYDLRVDTNGEINYDTFGDYETISGDDNVRQQVRLSVQRALSQPTTKQLTQERKREIRRDLRDELNDNPYVDSIAAIRIRTPSDEQLEIDVKTRSSDITVPVDR